MHGHTESHVPTCGAGLRRRHYGKSGRLGQRGNGAYAARQHQYILAGLGGPHLLAPLGDIQWRGTRCFRLGMTLTDDTANRVIVIDAAPGTTRRGDQDDWIMLPERACLTYNTGFRYNDGGVVVNARESDLDSSP